MAYHGIPCNAMVYFHKGIHLPDIREYTAPLGNPRGYVTFRFDPWWTNVQLHVICFKGGVSHAEIHLTPLKTPTIQCYEAVDGKNYYVGIINKTAMT